MFTKDVFYKELQLYFDAYQTQFWNKVVFDFDEQTDLATYYYGYVDGTSLNLLVCSLVVSMN